MGERRGMTGVRRWVALIATLGAFATVAIVSSSAAADGPTSPPRDTRPIVAYGHTPHFCTEADPNPFFQTTGALLGWAWSPNTNRWNQTPTCVFRWGFIGLSAPSVVIDAGGVATFSLTDSAAAPFIPEHGGASWSVPAGGTVVAGCTFTSTSCSVRLGTAGRPPLDFGYHSISLSAPSSFVTRPVAADGWRHCSPATPCPYLRTNVWGMIVVRPAPATPPPLAVGDAAPTGSIGEWRLDGSASRAFDGAVIERWTWTVPGVGEREGREVDVVIPREQLPATVTLEVEDDQGETSSTQVRVDESIVIDRLTIVPDPLVVGGPPGTATMTVRNDGAWPLTDVTGEISVATPTVLRRTAGPAPASIELGPGDETTIEFEVEAVRAGEGRLELGATGRSGARTLAATSRERDVDVVAPALQVVLSARPSTPEAGEEFELLAEVTNTGDTELTGIRTDGEALAAEGRDITVSTPSPGSIARLDSGESATVTYRVRADAGEIDFAVVARGTDGVAGRVDSNRAELTVEVAGSLSVTSVVGGRSGDGAINARGGETVTVNGTGFEDVTTVGIARRGGDEEFVTIAVEPTSDTELSFTAPETVSLLEVHPDGGMWFPGELYVYFDDPDAPGSSVVSDPVDVQLTGPTLERAVNDRTGLGHGSARAGSRIRLSGAGLLDVERVALFRAGTDELLGRGRLVEVADDTLVFETPDLVELLELVDGRLALAVDVYAGYDHDDALDGVVLSNPATFELRGPTLESATSDLTGNQWASLAGGEDVTVVGTSLDEVDHLVIRSVSTGEDLATVDVSHDGDERLTFATPDVGDAIEIDGDGVAFVPAELVAVMGSTSEPEILLESPGTLRFDFVGPELTSVESERTGTALAPLLGDDTITVTGFGLRGVEQVTLLAAGDDEVLATLDVVPAGDDELTFELPDLLRHLELSDDGIARVLTEVEVGYRIGDVDVRSNLARLEVSAPMLDEVVSESSGDAVAAARGSDRVTLRGDLLGDVTGIAFLRDDDLTSLVVLDEVDVVDDSTVVAEVPSMVAHLTRGADGVMGVDTQVVLFTRDDEAPDGIVRTNARPFRIVGPSLEVIETADGDERGGPATGGGTWVLEGDLRDVDWVELRRVGTERSLERWIAPFEIDDAFVEFPVPDMTEHLLRDDDGVLRAKVDVVVGYTSDAGEVVSNVIRYDFEGPSIASAVVVGTPTSGSATLQVDGRFLSEVDLALLRDPTEPQRAVTVPVTVQGDDRLTVELRDLGSFLTERDDGSRGASLDLLVGYEADGAPGGRVTSNPVRIDVVTTGAPTTVSSSAASGDTRLQISSNDGWSAGDYAAIDTTSGRTVRRVRGIGSLIFDAPLPFAVPAGTRVEQIDPPAGDTTPPQVTPIGSISYEVGDAATVGFVCDDGSGVGVEACLGSTPSGSVLDTSSVGEWEVTVTTWDRNGNRRDAVVRYQVRASSSSSTTTSLPESTTTTTSLPESTTTTTSSTTTTSLPESTATTTSSTTTSVPESSSPESSSPEMTAPDSSSPETTAPGATAPETTAPETTAPATTAPATTAPATTAPATTAPATTAPATTVPQVASAPSPVAPAPAVPSAVVPAGSSSTPGTTLVSSGPAATGPARPPGQVSSLPATGAGHDGLLRLAPALLVLGVTMVLLGRRRLPQQTPPS